MSENLLRDGNRITVAGAQSSTDSTVVLPIKADPVTGRVLIDSAIGSGTVTSVSVVTANGFGGTVATATTTPAITLTTSNTAGSVIFAGSTSNLAQDNANFFWDNTNKRLGIGTNTPGFPLHVTGNSHFGSQTAGTSNATVGGVGMEVVDTNNTTGGVNLILGNRNNGTSAFTDLFLQNDLADNTGTHFAVVNLNSSTYSNTAFGTGLAVANQLAIYGTDGPTMVGSVAGSGYVNFLVGGTAATNEIVRVSTTGLTVGLTGTLTGKVVFAGATSTSITLVGQAAGGSSTITLPAVTGTATVLGNTTTGSGSIVLATSPTLVTPTLGAALATSINGNIFTTGSSTYTGTAGQTYTFPTTTASIARTDAAQTFTGIQTIPQIVNTPLAATVTSNATTITRANRINNVTNSSAATLTITLSTSGALDGDMLMLRIFDFSAVAQTISWVNTENSTVTVPSTSNGSTTSPLTVGLQYNSATSKWRCIASA